MLKKGSDLTKISLMTIYYGAALSVKADRWSSPSSVPTALAKDIKQPLPCKSHIFITRVIRQACKYGPGSNAWMWRETVKSMCSPKHRKDNSEDARTIFCPWMVGKQSWECPYQYQATYFYRLHKCRQDQSKQDQTKSYRTRQTKANQIRSGQTKWNQPDQTRQTKRQILLEETWEEELCA